LAAEYERVWGECTRVRRWLGIRKTETKLLPDFWDLIVEHGTHPDSVRGFECAVDRIIGAVRAAERAAQDQRPTPDLIDPGRELPSELAKWKDYAREALRDESWRGTATTLEHRRAMVKSGSVECCLPEVAIAKLQEIYDRALDSLVALNAARTAVSVWYDSRNNTRTRHTGRRSGTWLLIKAVFYRSRQRRTGQLRICLTREEFRRFLRPPEGISPRSLTNRREWSTVEVLLDKLRRVLPGDEGKLWRLRQQEARSEGRLKQLRAREARFDRRIVKLTDQKRNLESLLAGHNRPRRRPLTAHKQT
jgi:hypothetical protein